MRIELTPAVEAQIVERVTGYCTEVLEWPNPAFGMKPACPFSRRERAEGRIQYQFFEIAPLGPTADVIDAVRTFPAQQTMTTLLLIDPVQRVTVTEAAAYGLALSRACREQRMIAIGVHPDDDYAVAGFQPRRGNPYVMMICQSAEYLLQAKRQLEGTGYYAQWSQAALDYNDQQIGQFLGPAEGSQ